MFMVTGDRVGFGAGWGANIIIQNTKQHNITDNIKIKIKIRTDSFDEFLNSIIFSE